MSNAKHELDRLEALRNIAERAAIKARHVEHCPDHDEVLLLIGDDESKKATYAIATNLLKERPDMGTREELVKAVDDLLLDASPLDCPYHG